MKAFFYYFLLPLKVSTSFYTYKGKASIVIGILVILSILSILVIENRKFLILRINAKYILRLLNLILILHFKNDIFIFQWFQLYFP